LADLPGGGGTPLALGLDTARLLAEDVARRGGTPVVVLLSDGRANLARDGSPGRTQAHADALVSARAWPLLGLQVLWLDTAPQPQATAQEVARTMGARYLPLPHADARQMAQVVSGLAG
jgi:magnesium chelatase subunit D